MINQFDLGLFILKLAVAVVFLYHSWPKLKNPQAMAQGIGWPSLAVLTLGLVEFLSSLGYLTGVYIQVSAFLLIVVMVGAISMKIMKWKVPFAAYDKTGWEFDFILLASNLAILLTDGGAGKLF